MIARENPFRTSRIGAIPYAPQGTTWEELDRRLAALHHRAAVVGPHGSGKTTFLRTLGERLADAGWRVTHVRLDDGRPALRRAELEDIAALGRADVLLLDGAGLLGRISFVRVRRGAHRAGGLVVSAHEEGFLPTLHRCQADPAVLHRIGSELAPGLLDAEECSRALAAHGGNMRDALLSFYDRCANVGPELIAGCRGTSRAPTPATPR